MKQYPIFDGHNDTLLRLYLADSGRNGSFFRSEESGHIDLPRAREAHFAGGFFAVFVPPHPDTWPGNGFRRTESGYTISLPPPLNMERARDESLAMASLLFQLEAESTGQMQVIRESSQLRTCVRQGILAAILHFEGAEAIDPELTALDEFYRLGLRSLGLVWSRPNVFAHGVPFRFPHSPDIGPGLSAQGKNLVQACNHMGIMLDLSHLNDQGFWDVARISTKPLVATHSNAHALSPSTRNLTDRQLDAIRESKGMVGLNFSVSDLRSDGHLNPDTPIEVMVSHIDYLVDRIGVDGVGFGSDFDGATISGHIGDVRGLIKLVEALQRAGYDDTSLRKLTSGNWLRVLDETWKSAERDSCPAAVDSA